LIVSCCSDDSVITTIISTITTDTIVIITAVLSELLEIDTTLRRSRDELARFDGLHQVGKWVDG